MYPLIDSSVASSHDINADYQYVTSEEAVHDTQISSDLSSLLLTLWQLIRYAYYHPVFDLLPPDPPVLSDEFSDSIVLNSSSRTAGFSLHGSAEPLGQVFIRLGYSTWTVDIDQDGHWYFELLLLLFPLTLPRTNLSLLLLMCLVIIRK